jgi:cell division protein FtsX
MEFDSWYKQLPFVTKHMLIGALATAALISFNIISYKYLVLDITKAFKQLQLWRLVSHFFIFGRFSVNFFFKMLML